MKWKKKANDWWVAQGEYVKFSIYRENGFWKGYYESTDGKKFIRLPWKKSVRELKELCENNCYWES